MILSTAHSTRVYITEKPSQARALGAAVQDGRITWCIGHLMELLEPKDYDPNFERWSLSDLPILPDSFQRRPAKGKSKEVARIRRDLQGAAEIVIATDAGREGELIAREVIDHIYRGRQKRPVLKRLWATALNPQALKKAHAAMKPASQYDGLADAAELRSISDWSEGINLTRFLTIACKKQGSRIPISVGRVQTPVATLIVRREREIRDFKPQDYFEIEAIIVTTGQDGQPAQIPMIHAPEKRIQDRAAADALAQLAKDAPGRVRSKTEAKTQAPPKAFELASLGAYLSAKKGWSAERTLKAAQALYEEHKATTYPRTDCPYLDSSDFEPAKATLQRILQQESGLPAFQPQVAMHKHLFNDAYIEKHGCDHTAIIPTTECPPIQSIPDPELRWVYEAIVRRFCAQFAGHWEYDQTRMAFQPDNPKAPAFAASGRVTTKPGWKVMTSSVKEDDQKALPVQVKDDTPGRSTDPKVLEKRTQPPARYTDGTLVAKMKSEGLGTKATWAESIKKIKQREYTHVIKGKHYATKTGETLVGFVERNLPELAESTHTANLEQILLDVEQGRRSRKDVEDHIRQRMRKIVQSLKAKMPLPTIAFPDEPKPKAKPRARRKTTRRKTARPRTSRPRTGR